MLKLRFVEAKTFKEIQNSKRIGKESRQNLNKEK